jgi:predicted aspartyl protease
MKQMWMLLFTIPVLAGAPRATLPLSRQGQMLILTDVYLNHRGPFRMLIDTGSASSAIPRALAQRLGLTPQYAVEQETPAGRTLVGATLLDEVKAGSVSKNRVEFMFIKEAIAGVDGILGQSWLADQDYLLDYRGRRLVFDPDPPLTGVKLPLRVAEGRPAVTARVGGRDMELVLDSGADTLALFGASPVDLGRTIFTANGSTAVGVGMISVAFGPERARAMGCVHVRGNDRAGLLPLAAFSAVYVSNRDGTAILMR